MVSRARQLACRLCCGAARCLLLGAGWPLVCGATVQGSGAAGILHEPAACRLTLAPPSPGTRPADTLRLLLVLGCQCNLPDKEGCTSLHWAAIRGHTEACTVLLQVGGLGAGQ